MSYHDNHTDYEKAIDYLMDNGQYYHANAVRRHVEDQAGASAQIVPEPSSDPIVTPGSYVLVSRRLRAAHSQIEYLKDEAEVHALDHLAEVRSLKTRIAMMSRVMRAKGLDPDVVV